MGVFVGCLFAASIALLLALPNDNCLGAVVPTPLQLSDSVNSRVSESVLLTNTHPEVEASKNAVASRPRSSPKRRRGTANLPSTSDCLGLPPWMAKPMRKWFGPTMDGDARTRFFLSTRRKRERSEVLPGKKFSTSSLVGFDASHRTVVIVHGFLLAGQMWVHEMANAILDKVDVNVFTVQWQNADGLLKYWKTVANMHNTANALTRFMEQLINEAGLRTDDLHLVGHSLGAHICGFVARSLKNVSRITGLDPMQACFKSPSLLLDAADASFVDVIHTNRRMLKKLGLDLPAKMGHVDFFPNGGMLLAECQDQKKMTWKTRVWRLLHKSSYNLYQKLSEAICSHGRAYALFTESVRKSKSCSFWGHPWDMRTESEHAVYERPCDMSRCSEMGYNSDLYPARGGFFVKATDTSPFCVSDQCTDAEMLASGFANLTSFRDDHIG